MLARWKDGRRGVKDWAKWVLGRRYSEIMRELDLTRLAIGRHEARTVRTMASGLIQSAEFRVFSQWGEDGIIQYILNKVPIVNRAFVEFGVQDYRESNTRFLLENDNWSGLVMDAGKSHISYLASSGLDWRYDIQAKSAFVTRENINQLIAETGFRDDVGLLSIDIDGNDYWVFEAIEVISPRIAIVEYNSVFGADRAVTIPYDPNFRRHASHYSGLYWGASLAALCSVATKKGYDFVGSNSAGNNAFFVRKDVNAELPALTSKEGYVRSLFRESRDTVGRLTFLRAHEDRLAVIRDMPVYDVDHDRVTTVGAAFS